MEPLRLLDRLGQPGTGAELKLKATAWSGGQPMSGWLETAEGAVVATLDRFKFDFVAPKMPSAQEREIAEAGGTEAPREMVGTIIPSSSDRLTYHATFYQLADYFRASDVWANGTFVTFTTQATALDIKFQAHPWSGFADVLVDGKPYASVDLFNPSLDVPRFVRIDNPKGKSISVAIAHAGRRNSEALGEQILIESVIEYSADQLAAPAYQKCPSRNRGGPFEAPFVQLMQAVDPEGIILDIGGGKRQIDDRRYVNLEYAHLEEPDIYGNGMALPFKSNSVDLIYSSAVLEHLRDPAAMGAEVFRVLKPGGTVFAGVAFMQPIHSEGHHFFNMTPWGMKEVFKAFPDSEVTWNGSFLYMMQWFMDVTNVRATADPQMVEKFLEHAAYVEKHITQDSLMYVAPAVWLKAKKPL